MLLKTKGSEKRPAFAAEGPVETPRVVPSSCGGLKPGLSKLGFWNPCNLDSRGLKQPLRENSHPEGEEWNGTECKKPHAESQRRKLSATA